MCWITTMGTGKFFGSTESIWISALGPPVEHPMTISLFFEVSSDAFSSTTGSATFARMVFIPDNLPIFLILSRRLSPPFESPKEPRTGVATTSRAPAPMASKTLEELPVTEAVTIRIGHGDCRMIRRVASTPSITGIMRSMRTRSGMSSTHRSTASWPFLAIQATERAGSVNRTRRRLSTAIPRSLIIPILMFFFLCFVIH